MKERGILFNAEMVRAILDGRKTQTRRVTKHPLGVDRCGYVPSGFSLLDGDGACTCKAVLCPYGQPGDRLWVRECWDLRDTRGVNHHVAYRADGAIRKLVDADYPIASKTSLSINARIWRPSIHMPRWASRITLEVRSVRVERVQDISDDDCVAEGIDRNPVLTGKSKSGAAFSVTCGRPLGTFIDLWNSINAKRGFGWDVNPWVWVVEFMRVDA